MRSEVYYNGKYVGSVTHNHSMTDDEIIDFAGVEFDKSHNCFVYDGELLAADDFEIFDMD